VRYLVMLMVSLGSATAYLTRHAIAPAATTIQAETGLTTEQMGYVLSINSIGYFVCQIPAGWLGTRFGTRFALSALCTAWSVCTVWFASVASFWGLVSARIAFGGMQAGLVPNSAKVVKDWFPLLQRGLASAANTSAMSVGGAATVALTAVLLESFSWRTTFHMLAAVSLVWAAGFYLLVRTRPEEHPWVNTTEIDIIRGTKQAPIDAASKSAATGPLDFKRHVRDALSSVSLWALCAQAGFRAAGYQMFVTWFPAFLEKGYGVTRESAGIMASSPLVGVVVGSLAGGVIIDWLLIRTGSKFISRCGVAIVALGLSGLLCVLASWTQDPNWLVAAVALGALFSGLGAPAAWAATMDVAGRQTAVVMALMNMGGTIGGFTLPIVVGYMIGDIERTGGDWNQILYLIAAIYWVAGCLWFFVNPKNVPSAWR
jgi:MFS family permease